MPEVPTTEVRERSKIPLLIVAAVIVGIAIWQPVARWFLLISVAIGVVAAVIIHFVNKRPVKTQEDEQVRLHLND